MFGLNEGTLIISMKGLSVHLSQPLGDLVSTAFPGHVLRFILDGWFPKIWAVIIPF